MDGGEEGRLKTIDAIKSNDLKKNDLLVNKEKWHQFEGI